MSWSEAIEGIRAVVPPMTSAMTFPLTGQAFWPYLAGAACIVAGISIFLNKRVRLAATLLGVLILLFCLVVWVTCLMAHPEAIAEANYLKDLGLAGGALLLAGAVPRKGE
jgi:uncharacterized membrane protein YphA (DoxX/SURF4 family)